MSGVGEPSWSVREHISCLGWESNSVQVVNADVPGERWLERARWAKVCLSQQLCNWGLCLLLLNLPHPALSIRGQLLVGMKECHLDE